VFEEMPDLRALEIKPRSEVFANIYVSSGASDVRPRDAEAAEFFLYSKTSAVRHVELLSLVAYMHRFDSHHLDVGHTMNIGRPWEPGSKFDRLLVSLPYAAGRDFELLHVSPELHIRFLWLIPISATEERFRHEHGLEALESRFDEAGIDFTDPNRRCLVSTLA
jgi:hypothetical protein